MPRQDFSAASSGPASAGAAGGRSAWPGCDRRKSRARELALTAINAAKLYGLHPRKGTIAVGSDADLAIWDADREVTIRQSMIHDAMDYTPY
jgi:dihydroorotase-like cyclic amidohydrolase